MQFCQQHCAVINQQETRHEMRILERDVAYIILSAYLLTLIHRYSLNRIQLKTFDLEHNFAQYIQYTDCGSVLALYRIY